MAGKKKDIERWPVVIDKIVEAHGCVVPDFAIQRAGCSRTKRKNSRPFVPNSEVSEAAKKRRGELVEWVTDMLAP